MTLFGECVGTGARLPVTISQLGGESCAFQADSGMAGTLDLWIGAIGPLPVTATEHRAGQYHGRFCEPLDERIIAHFAHS